MGAIANREYKNSVFTLLFNEPDKVLSLYNALSGRDIPIGTHVEITTLANALFLIGSYSAKRQRRV